MRVTAPGTCKLLRGFAPKGGLGPRERTARPRDRVAAVRHGQGARGRGHTDGRTDGRQRRAGRPAELTPGQQLAMERGGRETVSAGLPGPDPGPGALGPDDWESGARPGPQRRRAGGGAEPGPCPLRGAKSRHPEEEWGPSEARTATSWCLWPPGPGAEMPSSPVTGGGRAPQDHHSTSAPVPAGVRGRPCGGTHLTADVTDGHVDKDGGLLHALQVHVPIA